jgi:PAS domain-containing protein
VLASPVLELLDELSGGLLDAYCVVDTDQRIVSFNRPFFALFPRSVARRLKTLTLTEALRTTFANRPIDLAAECMESGTARRYDELVGHVGEAHERSLLGAAAPLRDRDGAIAGAFVCLRDVTDEAEVQSKYKTMLDQEAVERERLTRQVRESEAELVQLKDRLASVEGTLIQLKRGLLV